MPEQPETRICVLKLRLGACLTMPTKRLAADLHEASRLFNISRNAIVRAWERQAEVAEPPVDGPLKFAMPTNPYQIGWMATPTLARKIVSAGSQEVAKKLRARTPYNHPGKAHYVWQAILAHEAARPCYRQTELPVPCQDAKLLFTDSGYTIQFPI